MFPITTEYYLVSVQETEETLNIEMIENRGDICNACLCLRYSEELGRNLDLADIPFKNNYDCDPLIYMLFGGDEKKGMEKKQITIKKNGGEHDLLLWQDGDFTLFPFRDGKSFLFEKVA